MTSNEFKTIVSAFADASTDIISDKEIIVVKIRDELIEISLKQKGSELYIEENGITFPAMNWIGNRLARLPQLADRIIDYIPPEPNYIDSKGLHLKDIESNPKEDQLPVDSSMDTIINVVENQNALCSSVLYITSDAGEGKTTLINELSRHQAHRFKSKNSHWLLVPIQLAGRPFLRLDDIIIASMANRLRFPMYYYESFIELVKLGVIIPALDGFEEMFMESSTGEAISALGQLVNKLNSHGTVLISARKAYFDYKSFSLQAKLFDTLRADYVTFSRLSLQRWDKTQFVNYARKRKIEEPEKAYDTLASTLGHEHSILTRAVLVKQLLDLFTTQGDFFELLRKIQSGTADIYFSKFVEAIIEREANTKWIDRSGEAATPLLTTEQHFKLLSMLSQEMWVMNTDSLNSDIVDYIVDLFAEDNKLSPNIHRQCKERIKLHALIVNNATIRNIFSFDHDEFRQFFLGIAIAELIKQNDKSGLMYTLNVAVLPQQTLETIIQSLRQLNISLKVIQSLFNEISKVESHTSLIRENLGAIMIRIASGSVQYGLEFIGLNLPINSLSCLELNGITFKSCYFQGTTLDKSVLSNCNFIDCTFDRIELVDKLVDGVPKVKIDNVKVENCKLNMVFDDRYDKSYYDPDQINRILLDFGFLIIEKEITLDSVKTPIIEDDRLIITDKILRRFIRSTRITENIFRLKLGRQYNEFANNVLPRLVDAGIITKIIGAGNQSIYQLTKPMAILERALVEAKGDFEKFLIETDK